MYEQELAKGPIPLRDCTVAHINGKMHGELVLYLADVAGLASRGEQGLASLSESEKSGFRKYVNTSFYEEHPILRKRITQTSTPTLYALLESTERARQLILDILSR